MGRWGRSGKHRLVFSPVRVRVLPWPCLGGRRLVSFEGASFGEEPPSLGLTLAIAHVATEMRSAVGLPDRPGLLVLEADENSPRGRAGLERGDLLVRAGRRQLRSLADLYAGWASSASGSRSPFCAGTRNAASRSLRLSAATASTRSPMSILEGMSNLALGPLRQRCRR